MTRARADTRIPIPKSPSAEPLVRLAEELDVVEDGDAAAAIEEAVADGDGSVFDALGLDHDHRGRLADAFLAHDRGGWEVQLDRLAADGEHRAARFDIDVRRGAAFDGGRRAPLLQVDRIVEAHAFAAAASFVIGAR